MDQLTGIGVSPGVVAGPVARMAMATPPIAISGGTIAAMVETVADVDGEVVRAQAALAVTADELDGRAVAAGPPAADVLAAQAMMARDPVLAAKIADRIRTGNTAATAITEGFAEVRTLLAAAGPYFAERTADLDDVRDRTLSHLLGTAMPELPDPGHPFVLVAADLSPAQTALLAPGQVLAIVTERGAPTSHTAILAKALGIPAVVACPAATLLSDGQLVLVDGLAGTVDIEPEQAQVSAAQTRDEHRRQAAATVSGPGRTGDGHPVQLLVNIAGDRDVETAASADSEGVGLFRTEFLFLDRMQAPTVEEQCTAYTRVFQAFAGRKVIVRTLDAGADKPLGFLALPTEPNPALGVRGLRTARRRRDLLEDQLQAIAQAAAQADAEVWVMAPMVSTAAEAADFAAAARPYGLPIVGAMVEVPAAAIRADHIATTCDFLSIGTNDLAQYTMAADRMNSDLADLLDLYQPAVLDLIHRTAEAGARLGKPVGVCGEAASDPLLALVLVGLGVTSLSMAPTALDDVRAALAHHTLQQCQHLAASALDATDARQVRQLVRQDAATDPR